MEKLNVCLENCYGIKSIDATFDFTECRIHSIYAPNGSMKTSFSKTLTDYAKKSESKDAVFIERQCKRKITDESNSEINRDSVFVIEPYNKDFNSDKASLLLVNEEIKNEYDVALATIEGKKNELIKQLKQLSGLTGRTITPEIEICKVFGKKYILDIMENIPEYDSEIPIEKLNSIVYANIFNDKTISFLSTEEIKSQIKNYIERYDELVTKSPILNKKFNHVQAQNIHKSLSDSGFFDAKHSVGLFNGKSRDEFITAKDLEGKIASEKQKILNDKDLESKFDSIDKKLSNADLRSLRDYLYDNKEILVELNDLAKLQKNIFISYFGKLKDQIQDMLVSYGTNKAVIENAIRKAKEEKTQWEEVVDTFKKRFSVPFEISIDNQEDVILKENAPKLSFTFVDGSLKKQLERNPLIDVLSQGERRALYLMNILFEINARIRQGSITLLIIDDIADSFDYKNKYAIIEYLREITSNPLFYTIFLTHNYDFHRTISSRLEIRRPCRYFILRNDGNVILKQEIYQRNPFEHWKKNLHNQRFLLSSIPFVRNLAEYCGYESVFNTLTSALHIKSNTNLLKISDIEIAFKEVLKDQNTLSLTNRDSIYVDIIVENAESIILESNDTTELESKIILSMAIRLLAEKYMIKEINDSQYVESITKNQTIELYKRYLTLFPGKREEIQVLDEVNIMTPENIHLNSFMYEPILDMSPDNLKTLYRNIKSKLS